MASVATKPTLKAERRSGNGKEKARKLRQVGKLPAIVYGVGEPFSVALDAQEFGKVMKATHGDQVLLPLEIEGAETESVFVKDIQREPVSLRPIHVDLLRVDKTHKITLEVRIVGVGSTPEGVREGGLLEHLCHTVTIHCLPQDVPGHIEVDLTDLKADHSIHVSELPKLNGVEYLTDGHTAVFTIISKSRAEKKEEAAAAAATGAAEAAPAAAAPSA